MDLTGFWERVYIINLKRRADRLRTVLARMEHVGWPFREPIIYPAIEGDVVGVPEEFSQGGGAYGCRMSHLRILQDCLMDGVSSVLILEDDADMVDGFSDQVAHFLEKVPGDWEGIMLGGQHHAPPIPTGIPGVVRVRYAQRTHAYGARPSYMRALQARWGNCTVHIDWVMRDWQHNRIVYAPDPWLIGQAGGRSDIRGDAKPAEWWIGSSDRPMGPVALAEVTRRVLDDLVERGCHPGVRRDAEGYDVGLRQIFDGGLPRAERVARLRDWLRMIQEESVGGLLPTVWHPAATLDLVQEAWSGPVYVLRGDTADEAMACLPEGIRAQMVARQTLRGSPVVLLRCPREMIDQLRQHGFHVGYWRDPETGWDMGLKRLFEVMLPEAQRQAELRQWCEVLCREADRDGLIVTAIHPKLTVEMLRQATARPVMEVQADTIEALRRQVVAYQ